jgi:hypothetical protein
MKTTPIKRRILNVLVQYKDRPFLTVSEIAQLAYGVAYIRDTRRHLDAIVRRNIYSVMDLALENDMIVLPVKKRNTETNEIEKKTLGYKIAGKEDSAYIDMLLQDKEKRANAYILSYNRMVDDLTDKKLISGIKSDFKLITN